ncbi:hypothetical protein GCM10008955_26670 [Deinococcus malanensis]|uniref:Uncharacterized protein n=1 Tax=Deinococcus malanensis TaxID=1706855 RepID=A0ABQ2EXT5_9DEIO|nr:hypothetical protein [Deinococcus malanensis]GGK31499.1 hypothetical protein GCM10008955_26670 [Deinococcus malanensis]
MQAKLEAAVDRARDLGAQTVGLGGLNALAAGGGETLAHRTDIGVTNGNAFTAAMTLQGSSKPWPTPLIRPGRTSPWWVQPAAWGPA